MKVGVAGASGYAGGKLLRLLAGHPDFELAVAQADSSAGAAVAALHPGLAFAYPDVTFGAIDADELAGLDLVLLALPSGRAQTLVPELAPRVGCIVDLSADFRLRDLAAYPRWYGFEHQAPEMLGSFAFGIPELFRAEIAGARLVAAPGCYVTAAALAIAPLVRSGTIEPDGVIVDAASGVSGAGRGGGAGTQFAAVNEGFSAYGLLNHRHTPEIEQATGAQVLFTPHLAPMTRGILATCYARPADGSAVTTDSLGELLGEFYAGEPFVRVSASPPSTRETLGANTCVISALFDERTGYVLLLSALDNLVKGAAGQAVQAANVALGLEETAGLPLAGLTP